MSIETARSLDARAKIAGSISSPSGSHAPWMPCPTGTVGHGPNGTMIAGAGSHGRCSACAGGSSGGGSSSAKNRSAAAWPLPSQPHTTHPRVWSPTSVSYLWPLAPRDPVDRDLKQIGEPVLVKLLVGDALDDPPDRVPVDPSQPAGRGPVALGHQPRDEILEIGG